MAAPLLKSLKQVIDRFGIRPAAVAMVLACVALSGTLAYTRSGELVATGIAHGPTVALSTLTTAKVERVHVGLGQRVRQGQTLVTLESGELRTKLAEVEARIRQTSRSAELAQVSLLRGLEVDQQEEVLRVLEADRDARVAQAEQQRERNESLAATSFLQEAEDLVKAGLLENTVARERADAAARQKAEEDAAQRLLQVRTEHARALRSASQIKLPERLLTATAELYQAELEVLQREREGLEQRLEALSIRAPSDGVVSDVLPVGSVATPGTTIARVVPPFASDVVAYVPPDAAPPVLAEKTAYAVALADGRTCRGVAQARPIGEVERKPEQLVGPMGVGAYGFPVRIALNEGCQLPIGQIVELRLSTP